MQGTEVIRWDAEQHARSPLGWWCLFVPLVLAYVAVLYALEGMKRLGSGHCLLCPHHRVTHRGRCRWHYESYIRGAISPSIETIRRWEADKGQGTGKCRPCTCRMFLGNPWGRAEIEPDFGK